MAELNRTPEEIAAIVAKETALARKHEAEADYETARAAQELIDWWITSDEALACGLIDRVDSSLTAGAVS